jgi:ADP-heptose:LPS heptosyltransferase
MEPSMAVVLEGLPYVDEVIPFDRTGLKARGWWGEALGTLAFLRTLRQRRFDLVLDPLGTSRTAVMALATGARARVGFDFRFRKFAYTLVKRPSPQRRYIADFTADLLRRLGHEPDSLKLDFVVPDEARDRAAGILTKLGVKKGGKVLLVSPAGGWELKRYPPAQLARALAKVAKGTRLPILMVWGPGEEALCREASRGLEERVVLAPPTDFKVLGALLERSALLLCNDGATKHLAVALGTPSLTLFGPTSDVSWHPPADPLHRSLKLDLPCMPSEALSCRLNTHECFTQLPPERVAEEALKMLGEFS